MDKLPGWSYPLRFGPTTPSISTGRLSRHTRKSPAEIRQVSIAQARGNIPQWLGGIFQQATSQFEAPYTVIGGALEPDKLDAVRAIAQGA